MPQTIYDNLNYAYPHLYQDAVEIVEDQNFLTIRKSDGSVWLYDDLDRRVRRLPDNSQNMTEEEFRSEFGKRLYWWLYFKCIREGELAEAVGTSQTMISNYVRGRVTPSFYMIDKIAKFLDISIDELTYRTIFNE